MSKQSLLLVDHDIRSMRVLEVSLRKAGFTVTTAISVQDALDKLELDAPDLIISETTFPDGDGFELRRRVRSTSEWDEIPFIFLTAEAAIENKIRGLELGVDDYLTKPIYIKEIVTRINILLQKRQRVRFEERRDGRTRFAGRVTDMPVVDVIQTIEISRKSGVIQFVGDRGRQAAIYFRDGRVIDAEAGALQGEDAVYRLLTWSEGEFEVVFRTVRRREVISMGSQALLMEGMRRLDEWSRLLEQLPALTHRFEVDAGELSVRLGDVPDDNNGILRLIDGKRTLLEVIDASDVGDLECLQAISRLYFEEMLIDLDHGTPVRRDTGRSMPLVEVSTPTPIEDAASGPIDDQITDHDPDIIEEVEPGALMGGYRQSSLMLIDAAVAAAQAIEPSLFDDDEVDRLAGTAKPEQPPPVPAPTGIPGLTGMSGLSGGMKYSSGIPAVASPTPGTGTLRGPPAPARAPAQVTPQTGLIMPRTPTPTLGVPTTAAVAANSLASSPVERPNGAVRVEVPEFDDADEIDDDDDRIPESIEPEEVTPPAPERVTTPLEIPRTAGREDSGLRMIGSHGRDRAEASGELSPMGNTPNPLTTTQRELVTILPRRITRELEKIPDPAAEAKPTGPTERAEARPSIPPIELPPPPKRITEGSGVRRKSGPSGGALVLLALAAILAGLAVYMRLRKAKPVDQGAPTSGQLDAGMIVSPISPDAASLDLGAPTSGQLDAGIIEATVDAAVVATVDAAVRDAGLSDQAIKLAEDSKQSKLLMDQANDALQEGDFEQSLKLANASLKLRRTARAHLVKAQALQRLSRVEDALSAIDDAEDLSPRFPMVFELRGRILWAARREDEARIAFEQFLELSPNGATAAQIRRLLDRPR
ncbi:MAG TPA: DUF4388 domain-containing protein [Kofleriaceae bacterium]